MTSGPPINPSLVAGLQSHTSLRSRHTRITRSAGTHPEIGELMKRFARHVQAADLDQAPGVREITAQEREIDRVLAESFPASDPPPWTLGVAPVLADDHTAASGRSKLRRK
jgi:hypothetical protein